MKAAVLSIKTGKLKAQQRSSTYAIGRWNLKKPDIIARKIHARFIPWLLTQAILRLSDALGGHPERKEGEGAALTGTWQAGTLACACNAIVMDGAADARASPVSTQPFLIWEAQPADQGNDFRAIHSWPVSDAV